MIVPVAIIAHDKRQQMATRLCNTVGAEAIVWDNHNQGCEATHAKAWGYLQHATEPWVVFLEDDAVPVDFFREQLAQVLAAATTPIVSLYLGRGRPDQWQLPISSVIGTEACFIRSDTLLSTVGYAVQTPLLRQMCSEVLRLVYMRQIELPEAMTRWAQHHGYRISYSRPSIVDHLDIKPVIDTADRYDGQERTELRKAWLFDWRPSGTWNSSWVELPHYDLSRPDKVAEHVVEVHPG